MEYHRILERPRISAQDSLATPVTLELNVANIKDRWVTRLGIYSECRDIRSSYFLWPAFHTTPFSFIRKTNMHMIIIGSSRISKSRADTQAKKPKLFSFSSIIPYLIKKVKLIISAFLRVFNHIMDIIRLLYYLLS